MVVPNNVEDPEKLSLICQLVDLATSLRQERLFIISEQNHLQQLNINVRWIFCVFFIYAEKLIFHYFCI